MGRILFLKIFYLKFRFTIAVVFGLFTSMFSQEVNVKGIVFDRDSVTTMPYAYVVNKNSSVGTLSDEAGKFSIRIKLGDTLSFSYLGYSVTKLFSNSLKDSIKNSLLNIKIFIKPKINELKQVTIATHSFTKEQKEYYAKKVDEYHRGMESPLADPITAMYYAWSKKGKELQKLSVLYQQLLVDEVKEHRLSDQKIRELTKNDTMNVKAFLNTCFLPDQFILNASDYELYSAVNRYYREYIEAYNRKK